MTAEVGNDKFRRKKNQERKEKNCIAGLDLSYVDVDKGSGQPLDIETNIENLLKVKKTSETRNVMLTETTQRNQLG